MSKASTKSKGKNLAQHQDRIIDDHASKVYRFKVLLPNGLSSNLSLLNPIEEMPVRDLLVLVKKDLNNAPISGAGRPREIHWGNIYLTDLLDRRITDKIKLKNYDTKSLNILKLHDGMEEAVNTFENMWDLTPQTELLQELPAEYSTESALVDLIDNALQALWSNDKNERKLIKITVDKREIVIFDTGRGMDGSDGNSISKWGTMGSSNHRVFRDQGIGGKAPYLLPFFGLFGYGGTISSMHLGSMAVVSSKTKESRKVFTLHLSREALLKKSSSMNSKTSWKTAGGVRDPSKEEISLSPHQSFTQVEISGLKRNLEEAKLYGFLKDIYFPYIQYDEDNKSMNTRNPVEIEVFDHCGNHVEEGIKLNVHVDGFSFLDNLGSVRKVNGEGFINLCGVLRVVGSFGSQACMTISHHENKIFFSIFQIAKRELKAIDVPESCLAGSVLENIVFEVYDSDGLVDESIDGPFHTLKITSDGLPLVEGAQYAIHHGKCVVSHVQLPNKPGIITVLAYHTHYPDLQTSIQFQLNPSDLALMSLDDGPEPILSYPISAIANSNILLPSLPSHLVTYTKGIIEETSNKIQDTSSKISSTEKTLTTLYSRKKTLEEEIFILKGGIGHTSGPFIDAIELTCQKVLETIGTAAYVVCSGGEHFMDGVGVVALLGTVAENKIGRMLATYLGKDDMLAVVCKTLDAATCIEKYKADGTIDDRFGIHHKAAALGARMKRFSIICLDAIKPYGGVSWDSPQKELALPWPFPDSMQPNGFKGFAVNMINLSNENLNITTGSGYGLRETLFFSLFGQLQVYETRNDMLQALPYLKGGAISLDGGVIKGKGKLLLGHSEPKITFPVVTLSPDTLDVPAASQDVIKNIMEIDAKKKLLAEIEKLIIEKEKDHRELIERNEKKKRKFNQISDVLEPFSSLLDQCTPVQTPEKSIPLQTPQKFICKQ